MDLGWIFNDIMNEFRNASDPKGKVMGSAGINQEGSAMVKTRSLEDRLERQALVIQTLVAACIQKGVFTGSEFNELMIEIDESDGKRDGRVRENRDPKVCPSCERTNSFRATNCIYCSTELGQGHVV